MVSLLSPLFAPVRILASKLMMRTYIRLTLAFVASVVLLLIAIIAYFALYQAYIPYDEAIQPIYFDYSTNGSPNMFAQLLPDLDLHFSVPYVVSVCMNVPSNPYNMQIGNFMLSLWLYRNDPYQVISSSTDIPIDRLNSISRHNLAFLSSTSDTVAHIMSDITLMEAKRPAILDWKSTLLESLETIVLLPLIMTGWCKQSQSLCVEMIDYWQFNSSYRPQYVAVAIDKSVQIYESWIVWRVKWHGIRYLMRQYYITTTVVAVTTLWVIEMVVATLTWMIVGGFLSAIISSAEDQRGSRIQIERHQDPIAGSSAGRDISGNSTTEVAAAPEASTVLSAGQTQLPSEDISTEETSSEDDNTETTEDQQNDSSSYDQQSQDNNYEDDDNSKRQEIKEEDHFEDSKSKYNDPNFSRSRFGLLSEDQTSMNSPVSPTSRRDFLHSDAPSTETMPTEIASTPLEDMATTSKEIKKEPENESSESSTVDDEFYDYESSDESKKKAILETSDWPASSSPQSGEPRRRIIIKKEEE
ncbi:putative adipose-regulatory protein-domain-containing protein [Dipodascopsis uninucleata]